MTQEDSSGSSMVIQEKISEDVPGDERAELRLEGEKETVKCWTQNWATDWTQERERDGGIKFNSQVSCRSCLSSSTFPQYVAPSLPSSSENQSAGKPEDRIPQHFCYFCTMKPGDKNPSASYVRSGKCHKVGLLQLQRFQFASG